MTSAEAEAAKEKYLHLLQVAKDRGEIMGLGELAWILSPLGVSNQIVYQLGKNGIITASQASRGKVVDYLVSDTQRAYVGLRMRQLFMENYPNERKGVWRQVASDTKVDLRKNPDRFFEEANGQAVINLLAEFLS